MATMNLGSLFQASSSATLPKNKKAPLTRFTKKLVVPVLPGDAHDDVRDAFALYLMLCGTSKTTEVEEWKLYIAAYTAYIVPSLGSQYNKDVYTVSTISEVKQQTLATAYDGYMNAVEASAEGATDAMKEGFLQGARLPGFPEPDVSLPWHEGFAEVVPKIIVSHYAIVLFIMSKRVDATNHDPIAAKRPLALRGKAHIEDVCAFLDGQLRLSDESHIMINNAWAESSALRALSMREFATYQEMETDITQDLIYTSVHLMKFGNMTHAKITYSFLKAHPWVDEISSLQGAIGVYRDSILAASKHPEHLRPYLKLIYGDKLGIFPRNELEVLIDCAVAVEKETNPTIDDFFVSDKYAAIVEAFMSERARRAELRTKGLEQQIRMVSYDDPDEVQEVGVEQNGEAPPPAT